MRGRSTIILALLALLALSLTPATAIAGRRGNASTPQDRASTHAYIQANSVLANAAAASEAPVQASILSFNQKLGQECPKAGAGSPQNEESQKASYEVAGALWSITYGANAASIRTFVAAVKPLRWSNPKITHLAQAYAKSLSELAALPLPNLCGDVRAWSASGFQTIPAITLSFDEHTEAIQGHTIPSRMLAPSARPADKRILATTTRLETKLEHTETVTGFNDWDSLLETLGLNQ